MATPPTLSRPGVKVFTEFRTITTTPVVPALPSCVMGVAKEVVEAVKNDGSLNGDALVALPARVECDYVTATYTAIGGKTLKISVNNGATQTITFPATANQTPAQLKAHIESLSIPGLLADAESDGIGNERLVLRTSATGPYATLAVIGTILDSTGLTILKVRGGGYKETGRGGYNCFYATNFSTPSYPDPRRNLSELTVDNSTLRAFLSTGGGNFSEISKTSTFLRGATNAGTVVDDGDGDNLSPYVHFNPQDFTAAATAAFVHGNVDLTPIPVAFTTETLVMSVNGGPEQTLPLAGLLLLSDVVAAINLMWQVPSRDAVAVAGGIGPAFLYITSPNAVGEESVIRIKANAGSLALGLTAGSSSPLNDVRAVGTPYPAAIGDVLYANGVRLGTITEVAPAGVAADLRLDTEILTSKIWATFYIVAMNLDGPADAVRPSPDLYVDPTSGEVVIKHELFRDSAGTPTAATDLSIYLAYTGLRRDVSAGGTNATLLRISTLTDLETQLSPISPENPLGFGMYFAMLNAPGLEIYGLGISATSADEVDGTLAAWAEAFEFVESKEIYGIAALTHSAEVATLADAHVTAMAGSEVGLERCVFLNPSRPTRVSNTLIGSGSLGNATALSDTFSTGLANLPSLLAAAGLSSGSYSITDNLFLRMDNDTTNYLITSVSGSIVTVSNGAITGNDDLFYSEVATPVFTDAIVDRPFAIYVRGAALASLTEEAIAYATIPGNYTNRRLVMVTPDKAKASVGGLEMEIEGYYLSAALVGMTASKSPSDPLTEVGIQGFTGLIGASDRYGEIQYRIMDGGGLWSMMQERTNGPVKTRHQLTTDMSSVEMREFSILNALDFTAKFTRNALRNFIGRFNITTNLQSAISTTMEGIGGYLTGNNILSTFKVNRLIQNPDQPDSLLLDISVGVLYPCNEIRLTIIV